MTVAPQIIHACNHIVEIYDKRFECIKVQRRDDSFIDEVMAGINVKDIYSIYSVDAVSGEYKFYNNEFDFIKFGASSIRWISDNCPRPNSEYIVECFYTKQMIKEYDEYDCPRCAGNGWYVDLLPEDETCMNILSGPDKIVQDFIKILFTYKGDEDNYGTRIADYVGTIIDDPTLLCSQIASIIYEAANQYMNIQSDSIMSGVELNDDEILDNISVDRIEYDEYNNGVYALITLFSRSGESRKAGIGI